MTEKSGGSKPSIRFSGPTSDPVVEDAEYGHRDTRGQAGVDTPRELNTEWAKARALGFGADIVGVCSNDDELLRPKGEVAGLGGAQRLGWVVVMAVKMERESFRESPSPEIRAATREGYARMKVAASSPANAIADRGYECFAAGNGEAGSVALAARSGLGQLGRNGMLLARPSDDTRQDSQGSCIRICKVFTSMPLVPDAPSDPVNAGCCVDCDDCARACPARAIEIAGEPSGEHWKIDGPRCRKTWTELGTNCAACITHCPKTWSSEAGTISE